MNMTGKPHIKAQVLIRLKKGLLDPQGKAVEGALHTMGYPSASHVRVGKVVELQLLETDPEKAKQIVSEMSQKLLSNPIIEDFEIHIPAA